MQYLRIARVILGCATAALLVALLPVAASAHERRELVGGRYELTIGFIDEPAFVGEKNGLWLEVVNLSAAATTPSIAGEGEGLGGVPVEGLFGTLQAEVIFGDQRMSLPLTPAFGEPGVYQSIFFPTQPGDYTFHIFGDLEGNPIDETFTSSPEGFDAVQPVEPYQFPKPAGADAGSGATVAGSIGGAGAALDGTTGGLLGGLAIVAGAALWAVRRVVSRRRAAAPVAVRV